MQNACKFNAAQKSLPVFFEYNSNSKDNNGRPVIKRLQWMACKATLSRTPTRGGATNTNVRTVSNKKGYVTDNDIVSNSSSRW